MDPPEQAVGKWSAPLTQWVCIASHISTHSRGSWGRGGSIARDPGAGLWGCVREGASAPLRFLFLSRAGEAGLGHISVCVMRWGPQLCAPRPVLRESTGPDCSVFDKRWSIKEGGAVAFSTETLGEVTRAAPLAAGFIRVSSQPDERQDCLGLFSSKRILHSFLSGAGLALSLGAIVYHPQDVGKDLC